MPRWIVANEIIEKLGRAPSKVEKGFLTCISLESINIDYVYKKVRASIKGVDMRVDLIPVKSHDFDVISGMDWFWTVYGPNELFCKDGYSLNTVWQKRNI
jgi:hypothetical protein